MSFSWFRKHQTLFLWGTVIFCVLIFATFSGFSDLQALVQGSGKTDTIGRFTTATSNELIEIGQREFIRTRNAMNRYRAISGQADGAVDDEMVWQFLILREDAKGADVVVSDGEVAGFLQAFMGAQASKEFYTRLWRDFMQFASPRECEQFFHDMMLGGRWVDFQMQAARIVDADDVYTRWASDNMRFDLDALVIPDTPLDEIADLPRDELQAWFDEQPQAVRDYRYADPKKHDIVYAWL
ncbi:MAG: SurA N-terminal domain-containing protein, partial [Planctomycetota bacterium]